jgi:patatin-like phospholipase/acyl hydrolase
MTENAKRILAIDGGGINGVLPAAFLAAIEDTTGKRIVDHFDLIAGTSTGGIIALGLGLGLSANDILRFYRDQGPRVFHQELVDRSLHGRMLAAIGKRWRHARQFAMPKYDQDRLCEALTEIFGERVLGESGTRLVIPAYHARRREVYVFKTAHHRRFQVDWKARAVDVALSTAAAPTYFPGHRNPNGAVLLDGGIWANNPVGMAVVEGIGVLGWAPKNMYVLSLGCTEDTYTIPGNTGKLGVGLSVQDIFLQGQSRGSIGTAKLLTGHSDTEPKFFRFTHTDAWKAFGLDKVSMIDELRGLGAALARDALPTINHLFLDTPTEPFESYYA